jgi:hypothetical protein
MPATVSAGVRLVPVLVVALIVAGCGGAQGETNLPASSEGGATLAQPKGYVAPDVKPPAIVLVSQTGEQPAVQGSYCVTGIGQGTCADMGTPTVPNAVTVVQPGDPVTIVLRETTLKPESAVTIRPLGCTDREVEKLALPASGELRWKVALDPGGYQLDVFAIFEADDGTSGDTSGTLGLFVGGAKNGDALGVLEVRPRMQVCKFTE